ncbi:MAG: oligosaccharide flippase family protein, partial [Candidatus Omnitrophica bacterium]|nr:oligosaccharide flippase family protein [Candidatus Omnitrophota bacterium]
MSTVRKIGKNISFMILSRAVAVIVSFFIFPFIVRHVGKEVYGVYLMAMTITGYFGILDFGVMSALTKYVSEYNGKKDLNMVNKIVAASFTFYALIGVVISVLLFICAQHFSNFFKINISDVKVMKELLMVAGASALLVWPLSTFRGTVQGLNLWNVDAVVNIVVQVLNAAAAFILLSSGYGIVQLFIVSQLTMILGSVFLYYISEKNLSMKIKFPYLDAGTFKTIFSFSVFMFISSVIAIFIFQVHNIIIGYFISMSAITVYAVAYNIQGYFRAINSTLGAPPSTMAPEMEGRRDYEGQRNLLFKGTKYMSAVFIPVVLTMFFFAEPFI